MDSQRLDPWAPRVPAILGVATATAPVPDTTLQDGQ
jgi:hypothetical protein